MKKRSKKRRPPATMMADLEKALRPILGPVLLEHSRTGGPLSDQTKADLDKALRPVLQRIETGSTDQIIIGIKMEPEPEPAEAAIGMFDHIVEHCYPRSKEGGRVRLVGLRRVGTERQVPTTRQRCCPRRKDRLGWDGVAMVTEPVLQPRSQDGPPNGVPRSFPGDSSPKSAASPTGRSTLVRRQLRRGEFRTYGEAAQYARDLVESGCFEPPDSKV